MRFRVGRERGFFSSTERCLGGQRLWRQGADVVQKKDNSSGSLTCCAFLGTHMAVSCRAVLPGEHECERKKWVYLERRLNLERTHVTEQKLQSFQALGFNFPCGTQKKGVAERDFTVAHGCRSDARSEMYLARCQGEQWIVE